MSSHEVTDKQQKDVSGTQITFPSLPALESALQAFLSQAEKQVMIIFNPQQGSSEPVAGFFFASAELTMGQAVQDRWHRIFLCLL